MISNDSSGSLLPTAALVRQLISAERDCLVDWLSAMAELPGNPLQIAIEKFGQTTALVCGRIPAEVFNRVIGLTDADVEHIPAILKLYAHYGARPTFDLNPYEMLPFWEKPKIVPALAQLGFYQGASHQMLYMRPNAQPPIFPSNLSVHEATAADAETFARVYEQVWGDSTAVRVLLGQSHFRCYLAYVDQQPAALGVLHIAAGGMVASMANALTIPSLRGHGCQTALLDQRSFDAAQAGCELLVSQCRPGSTSQNNQLRAGFKIAGTKAWWVPNTQAPIN